MSLCEGDDSLTLFDAQKQKNRELFLLCASNSLNSSINTSSGSRHLFLSQLRLNLLSWASPPPTRPVSPHNYTPPSPPTLHCVLSPNQTAFTLQKQRPFLVLKDPFHCTEPSLCTSLTAETSRDFQLSSECWVFLDLHMLCPSISTISLKCENISCIYTIDDLENFLEMLLRREKAGNQLPQDVSHSCTRGDRVN